MERSLEPSRGRDHDVDLLLGSVFGGLPPEALTGLLSPTVRRSFAAGDVLFRKGDPGSSMLVLLEGCLKAVAYSAEGREVILNVLSPGSVIGEIALFDGGTRTADVIATEPGTVLVLERQAFIRFVEHWPHAALHCLAILSEKLRRTSELVEVVALLPLEARLARLLLAMASTETKAARPPGAKIVDLRQLGWSQKDLAARIGVTREAVNRQLHAWADLGWVELPPGRIELLEVAALQELSQADL